MCAASACWYSERRPNTALLRARIDCLQAASEVSTAVQKEKHLQTSWSYSWRAAQDNDGEGVGCVGMGEGGRVVLAR